MGRPRGSRPKVRSKMPVLVDFLREEVRAAQGASPPGTEETTKDCGHSCPDDALGQSVFVDTNLKRETKHGY